MHTRIYLITGHRNSVRDATNKQTRRFWRLIQTCLDCQDIVECRSLQTRHSNMISASTLVSLKHKNINIYETAAALEYRETTEQTVAI